VRNYVSEARIAKTASPTQDEIEVIPALPGSMRSAGISNQKTEIGPTFVSKSWTKKCECKRLHDLLVTGKTKV